MKNFNWDGKVAVYCDAEEKANDFLREAHEHGFKWNGGGCTLERNHYGNYKKETCYDTAYDMIAKEKLIMLASLSYYIEKGYKIVKWEIDNMKEFTEEDLKVGMLVETRRGEKAIIMPEHNYLVASYANGDIADIDFANDSFSIVKVWSESSSLNFLTLHRTLLWERKEVEEMTVEAICEELERNIRNIK